MADERCKHEQLPGQCSLCAPIPKGLTGRVVITAGGSVFHRNSACEALKAGQRKARRFGKENHDPKNVALAVALDEGRGACIECFPDHRPSSPAKPCWVLVNGTWVRGLLTKWDRGPDGRWSGKVTCVVDGDQVTMAKDQAELRQA